MSNSQPQVSKSDSSNGWEAVAPQFIRGRHKCIGVAAITNWAKNLPKGSNILDLGCGFGVPISEALINQGFNVYGLDASPSLIAEFKKRFPDSNAKCEAVEFSDFFGKKFDGIIAIGLMFLLSSQTQKLLIGKMANSLKEGGKLVFTAPWQICTWDDLLTGRESISLGRDAYLSALDENGLRLIDEFSDDGDNHYFSAVKKQENAL